MIAWFPARTYKDIEMASTAEPDFAALFPPTDDDILTARTASVLQGALYWLADHAYDDVEAHGGTPVELDNRNQWTFFADLPPVTWQMNAEWRRNLARTADDLAGDLARGEPPEPRCPAEEAMLLKAIDLAQGDGG
jgi:hypothetical protein